MWVNNVFTCGFTFYGFLNRILCLNGIMALLELLENGNIQIIELKNACAGVEKNCYTKLKNYWRI